METSITESVTKEVIVPVSATANSNKTIKPVHIDGGLYVLMGVAGSVIASLSTEAAEKFINPYYLFIWRTIFEAILAGAGSLKMYRSTGYSNSISK